MHLPKSFSDFDNDRVARWLERLMQYDSRVKRIKGIANVIADALSLTYAFASLRSYHPDP